jgi:hypothetical protein
VLNDPPGGHDAIQDRHAQVHQHNVKTPFGGQGYRLFPVAGLSRKFHVILGLYQHADTRTEQGLVINQGHGDERPSISHGRLSEVSPCCQHIHGNHIDLPVSGQSQPKSQMVHSQSQFAGGA